MTKNPKPADIPTRTIVEYLEKHCSFRHMRHESGGIIVGSPDFSKQVLIPRGHKALSVLEIRRVLEALGCEPHDIEKTRVNLIRYEAGLFRSTEDVIRTLETTPHERQPLTAEGREWMDNFFKKMDAADSDIEEEAREKTAKPKGGIIYDFDEHIEFYG